MECKENAVFLTFTSEDKTSTIYAYKSKHDDDQLFVPFKDETKGKETYGAARYPEFYEIGNKIGEQKWSLDFNLAANLWCAAKPKYACFLFPTQNISGASILAGEKNYEK
ncbi:MAG: DUF1684 domain-containing protein [Candidatus Cloacimonetes bacterium]|nr:DUF1684 domain-containing protein [Candidatus Cloacimonadota bacterium]